MKGFYSDGSRVDVTDQATLAKPTNEIEDGIYRDQISTEMM